MDVPRKSRSNVWEPRAVIFGNDDVSQVLVVKRGQAGLSKGEISPCKKKVSKLSIQFVQSQETVSRLDSG